MHTLHSSWIRLTHSCQYFQKQHPLLICSLYWLTGIISRPNPYSGIVLLSVLYVFTPKNNLRKQLLMGACWLIPLITLTNPSSIHEGPASGNFIIKFGRENKYFGEVIRLKYPCGKTHYHIPCTIFIDAPLELNKKYSIQGTMLNHTSQFIFKSNGCYQEIRSTKIALIQHKIRESCHQRILNLFRSSNSGNFASSLLLGTPLPKHLREIFKNKGLSHLFAVSGWHFSLFASVLFCLLGIFPAKIKYFLSLIILSILTLVFPWSPSVWRAWLSLLLICLSPFSSGLCSSLNRLGAGAILCSLIFPPLSPAFSLSFLATLGILLFFPHLFHFFYSPWLYVCPKRLLPILRYIFGALSLTISAQIFLFFPMINFFGSLPLEGFIYNLFFPMLILPIFFLILLSLILPFLAPCTEFFISWLLELPMLNNPNFLTTLTPAPLPAWKLSLVLSLIFLLGVFLGKVKTSENHPSSIIEL